jgi:hypothetical protein
MLQKVEQRSASWREKLTVTPLPLNRALKVLVYQELSGQQVINRFHYLSSQEPSNSELLAFLNEFRIEVWNRVRVIQSNAVVTSRFTAEMLGGNLGIADLPVSLTGSAAADSLPPEAAYSIRFARTSAGVRGGFKRIAGVTETAQSSGVLSPELVNSVAVGQMLSALVSPLTVGSIDYVPIVIVGTYNGQPLPQLSYWQPTAAALKATVGTQNTRRRGRGA